MDTIGQRIKKLREIRGYTQKQLAQKAQVHEMTIQFYEYGTRKPKVEQLEKLAVALDIDIAFLQPSKTDSPRAILALVFDLIDEYGDVIFKQNGGTVTFGIDHMKNKSVNLPLGAAMRAHEKLTLEDFKRWLIDYPPIIDNYIDKDKKDRIL